MRSLPLPSTRGPPRAWHRAVVPSSRYVPVLAFAAVVILGGACGSSPRGTTRTPAEVATWPEVAPDVLAARVHDGIRRPVPTDRTKAEIARNGQRRLAGQFRLCVDASGDVAAVQTATSSGMPAFDVDIRADLLSWTFEPGEAACTTLTIQYVQREARAR